MSERGDRRNKNTQQKYQKCFSKINVGKKNLERAKI